MADNCNLNFSIVPKIDSVIKELEHNNPTNCIRLSDLINTEEFINYVKSDPQGKDVTDLESIGNLEYSVLKELISEFRNSKIFNIYNTAKVKNSQPLYRFESYEAFRVGKQYLVDELAKYDINETEENKRKDKYTDRLKDKVKYFAFKRLLEIANKYGAFDGQIKIKVKNDKGAIVTRYNMELLTNAMNAIIDNGTDIEKNFKDFVNTIWHDAGFWKEAFYNNKISHLRERFEDSISDDIKASLLFSEDEDVADDTENYDDTVISNEQWSISETASNFTKLLSERTKNYFNTLPRLSSTVKKEDGKYDVDTYNALGVPTYHNYQECAPEIISAVNMMGGFHSKEKFIEVLRLIAENKPEFAAFAKVADDFEKNDNLCNKVYSDLSSYVFDKLEVRVGPNNSIEVGQSNNNNSPVRKMFFNLRNELKSSAISNNNVELNDIVSKRGMGISLYERLDIIQGRYDKYAKNPNQELLQRTVEEENRLIEDIKDLFKTYFPSLNESAIDSFILKNPQPLSKRSKLSNISYLLGLLQDLTRTAKDTAIEYGKQELIRRNIFIENSKAEKAYKEALAAGMEVSKPDTKKTPEFEDYLVKAESILSKIANAFEPYTYSKAELNSRTVDNKLSSDAGFNNMITNIVKICKDKELLSAWVKEKMKSTEYDYSNILIDNPTQGIKGLFRKTDSGDYVLTEYADAIIDVYLLNGAVNENTDAVADYKKMSDADYFLTGLYSYALNTKGYRKYNTGKKYVVNTVPFLMRIPSDAPKNFAINMPKYGLQDLYKYNNTEVTKLAKEEYKAIGIHEIEAPEYHDVVIQQAGVLKNISIEDMATVIVSGQDAFKISNGNIVDKSGDTITIGFQVINDDNVTYVYYTGNRKSEGKELFIENARIMGIVNDTTNPVLKPAMDMLTTSIMNKLKDKVKREHPRLKSLNTNHGIFNAVKNILKGEIFDYYKALEDIKNHKKEDLVEWFHYNPRSDKPVSALTGNAFTFMKLDDKVGIEVDAEIKKILSSTGGQTLLSNYTKDSTDKATIDFSSIEAQLDEFVASWLGAFEEYSINEVRGKFKHFVEGIDNNDIFGYMINSYIHFNNFDDLFEGNSKYYANPQTFLKRAKESQAGGTIYPITRYVKTESNTNPFSQSVENLGVGLGIKANGQEVGLRSGWYGVTIRNTIRGSSNANDLYEQLIAAGSTEEKAKEIAQGFGLPYTNEKGLTKEDTTKVNDAQSYITIYEVARRLKILGEYEKYETLINQLTDDTTDIKDINPNQLLGFIQVMKNFYFDHYYNNKFGRHLPRQIKNAEYVLVPKFLKDTSLGKLADIMIELDIDQINTQETSKAANYSTLTFWDNNGEVTEEAIEAFRQAAPANKQAYSYMYLYKQQDVPQHILDARNKAGIQVMKKILDNIADFNQGGTNHALNFVNAYVANIKEDFQSLMDRYGIMFDSEYNIVSKSDENTSFKKIYDLALQEASRLGLDNNMLDYLTFGVDGQTIMPNFMNVVASKIESIAQSQFNKFITRQKLPGWHAAQVTSVGMEKIIEGYRYASSHITDEGKRVELRYHPKVNGKQEAYAEVLLPKWAKSMFNKYDKDGNLIKEIRIEDCDEEVLKCLGYRIPTEGKQSMAILKVVGFLPEWMGSTIVVPDEWVSQTGSDFDVDSIYGICFETYVGKDGRIHKVPYVEEDTDEAAFVRYAKYVNSNTSKLIKGEHSLNLTKEEFEQEKAKIKAVKESETKQQEEFYRTKVKDKIENEQSEAWHNLSEEIQDKLKILQRKFKEDKVQFKDRVSRMLDYIRDLEVQGYDEQSLQEFKKVYEELRDVISEQIDFAHDVFEDIGELLKGANKEYFENSVRARARAAELMSFEEFKQLSIEEQNSRKARNNRILQSMIAIMNDASSLEEQLSRSNFDDITEANKSVDKLKGSNKGKANVYNVLDQVQFHRNAMSGATLKAFSVARDTGTSVFNVTRAELAKPIYVKYGKNVNMNVVEQAFNTTADGIVIHDRIGNSKNNKNVKGNYITVASSHTTAHILDAIKEGAIENENEFTFAAFKTLFDIGVDAYTAILWIRQPGIDRLVKHYYEKQSVFQKGYGNEVYTAIKEIAKELGIKINGELVSNGHSIQDVMSALQEAYGEEFADLYNGSTISFDNKDDSGVNIIDVELMEARLRDEESWDETAILLTDLATILQFQNLNEKATKIANHVKVLNPDKFGAKQTIFSTRKVLKDIAKLINNKEADFLKVGDKTLIEAIYPGISALPTGGVNLQAYLDGDNNQSAYKPLDAFLRYSTVPSILVNKRLFKTESDEFVKAIEELETYLDDGLDEDTYNDFKKYVLTDRYKASSKVIRNAIVLDEYGHIGINERTDIIEEGRSPVREEMSRIYGFHRPPTLDFEISNINNPTDEELAAFQALSPAQKVAFIQSNLSGNERTIFEYLKVNLYNEWEIRKKGVSSQTIRFDDQQTDMNVIYDLFEEIFDNTNDLVRLTAIDLIKYAFVVEGFNFRKGNITKIIKNDSLYRPINENGTGIIDDIRDMVDSIDIVTLSASNDSDVDMNNTINLYENYIRSHSTSRHIKNYRVKYDGRNRPNISPVSGTSGMYYFNLSDQKDLNFAKEIGLIKEVKRDGEVVNALGIKYINIHNKGKVTLYKVAPVEEGGNIVDLYMYPLNLLESYESSKFSSNPINNIYAGSDYYEAVITELQNNLNVHLKDMVNNKHTLFDKETIKGYKFVRPKTNKENVVPTDPQFVSKLVAEGHTSIKKNLVDEINAKLIDSESGKAESIIYCWLTDEEMNKAFRSKNTISIQTIKDENGVPRQYAISRVPNKAVSAKATKKLNDRQLRGVILAQRNGVKVMTDIYAVRRYTPKQEVVKPEDLAFSSIDIDTVTNDPSVSGKLAQQMVIDIKMRARNVNDNDAVVTFKDIKEIGFDEYNRINIENKKQDTIQMAVKYYREAARRIQEQLDNFMPNPDGTPDNYLSITDFEVIGAIGKDEDLRNRYISLILQASTFGKAIDLIYYVPDEELSSEVKQIVDNLRTSINSIRNSNQVRAGFKIINDKIWATLSTNPLLENGFTDIANYITRDASTLDWMFQDTQEVAIPIIQIILNQVKSKFNTRLMEIEPEVAKYKEAEQAIINEANKAGQSINWDNIINPATGRFILNYDEKIFEDDRELELKVRHAREDYGEFSKEYLRAKHERDKWLIRNKEQQYVSEYYQYVYNNEDKVLDDFMIDYYIQYLKLKDEYHKLLGISKADRTEAINNQIKTLRHNINQMTDVYDDVTGEFKDENSLKRANRLKSYSEEVEKIKKAFFVRETRLGFKKDLEHYLKIINKYNKKINGKQVLSEYDLLQIPEYAEAVDWFNENTIYSPNEDFIKQLNEAYSTMSNGRKRQYPQFTSIVETTKGCKDIYGVINGRMFNEKQVAAIKREQELIYDNETNDTNGETKLIRNRPDNDEIYSEKFYKGFKSSDEKLNKKKIATIKEINAILVKAVHPITGKIRLSELSIEELNKLAKLYDTLSDIKFDKEKDPKVKKFIKENVDFKSDDLAYATDRANAEERDKYEKGYLKAFYKVAAFKEYSDGSLMGLNYRKGNTDIYDYVKPKTNKDGNLKNPDFLDKEKTEARKFITDNVDMVTTQYYEEAKLLAEKEGKLAEWEEANHVYNPHTRRMEPLRIWTRRRYKEHIDVAFRPSYSNTKSTPKDHTINSKFDRFSAGYKEEGDYGRISSANDYERRLRDLMMNTVNHLAGDNHTAMGFISQNFAPRRGRVEANFKNAATSFANALGFGQSLDPDRHFSKFIGFEHDKEANIPMLNHIKTKGYKRYEEVREKEITETDEHYQEYLNKIREINEQIRKDNLALEAAAMDKDYSSVMEQFVREALLVKARQESKLDVYYLLEYLRSQHQAYRTNTFGGLAVDKELSTRDGKVYETATPKNAVEMVETWAKRFLFDEYRPKAKFDKAAAVMQNIASAKFMMMNITGGIGNLLTGSTNIFMERFAGEYFSHSAWEKAKFQYYLPNVTGFILNSGKSTTNNLVDGIIKLFNVVDYNGISETARSVDAIEIIEKMRNYAYSSQTSGEHFMQNTAMFAMMIDNRIVNVGGKPKIMSFASYTRQTEQEVMRTLLANNPKLTKLYNDFIKNIEADKNKLKEYHWFNKDANAEFLRTIVRLGEETKEIGATYRAMIKDALKEAKESFESNPTVIEQFELDEKTGLAKLKESSEINLGHLGKFKEKVVSVNKKIHGVYDKLGGAQIESRWVFGSLIMQYHKYIYMGGMKHWRLNGYYNESRESIERGVIQSLWKFCSIEFYDVKGRTKKTAEQENIDKFRAAMQVVCRSFINTFLNYTFNKNVMSQAELANMRRALGDFVGIATGVLGGIAANCALIGANDDDEVATKLASLALYQMDRLSSEVAVFSYGALTEVKKLYSNPIAIGQTFTDLQNSFGFIAKYLMEGDEFNPYYTTGRYKGEHKLKVYFERQIPIWRNIDRLNNIDQNNKYYKLGENMLSIIPTKDIAEWIME